MIWKFFLLKKELSKNDLKGSNDVEIFINVRYAVEDVIFLSLKSRERVELNLQKVKKIIQLIINHYRILHKKAH